MLVQQAYLERSKHPVPHYSVPLRLLRLARYLARLAQQNQPVVLPAQFAKSFA